MEDAFQSGWLIAIVVAVAPALFGVLSALVSREARTPREIRNLAHLANALASTPDGSETRRALDEFTAVYTRTVAPALSDRKSLNKTNVTFTMIFFALTGVAMYWLVQWITVSGSSGWTVVAVILTVVVGAFLFVVNVAAVTTWYKPPRDRDETPKQARGDHS